MRRDSKCYPSTSSMRRRQSQTRSVLRRWRQQPYARCCNSRLRLVACLTLTESHFDRRHVLPLIDHARLTYMRRAACGVSCHSPNRKQQLVLEACCWTLPLARSLASRARQAVVVVDITDYYPLSAVWPPVFRRGSWRPHAAAGRRGVAAPVTRLLLAPPICNGARPRASAAADQSSPSAADASAFSIHPYS